MTKSGNVCDKRRNCTFCAISSFVIMFSKSRLLQRRQKASIWAKGLTLIPLSSDKMGIIARHSLQVLRYLGRSVFQRTFIIDYEMFMFCTLLFVISYRRICLRAIKHIVVHCIELISGHFILRCYWTENGVNWPTVNPFPRTDPFWNPLQQATFENIVAKGEIQLH